MPNMNGFDLYDTVRKIDNKVKACFLTAFGEGYTEEFERRFPASSLMVAGNILTLS
jgi:two-component SAPR family response regulator